ncbi:MAG TPA: VOC family protein [Candidatus Binatia bacterium]|nr:VOC family protein [Candidatus Binatia bacterium]
MKIRKVWISAFAGMTKQKTRHPVDSNNISRLRAQASLIFRVLFLVFSCLVFPFPAVGQLIKSVETIGMTVSNMDGASQFFSNVLRFEKISDFEVYGADYEKLQGLFGLRMRVVRMKLGEETLELTQYLAPEGRPIPADWRSNDRAFQHIAIVVADMDKAYQHLRAHNVRHASTAPQLIPAANPAAAGIRAFYFKDPDGHYLELIHFPQGKGDPRWQQKSDKLFLGIDHTAVVVSSTENSLRYYRDLLGMRLAGESMNSGTEQEHLNNVAGARLRISGLRAISGPGIEFLEYLSPRNGRPAPKDTRANDIWHWQTMLRTGNAEKTFRKLNRGSGRAVSSGIAEISEADFGFTKGFLARDPDGHGLQIVEK